MILPAWPVIPAKLAGGLARMSALVALAAVAGCQQPPPPVVTEQPRLYAFDFAGGAKQCTAPSQVVPLAAGKETPVALTMGNDGGWCAFKVAQSGKPFAAGLVTARAAHGKVYIHTVGNDTRVDYTPDPRYAGPDSFAVRFVPGDLSVRASVTVGPG